MSSQNINISLKHKPISNNGSSAMSYSPSSHTMPALFQHRDSFVHQRELESAFCSDLVCCGMRVRDLHELLHHYEEHHHAPIEEEPEPKEEDTSSSDNNNSNNNSNNNNDDDDVMMDEDFPTPLPTQPHELAALTSSPLMRKNDLRISTVAAVDSPISTPINLSPTTSMSSITSHQQHIEDILKQALPSLVNSPASALPPNLGGGDLHYFRSEALYQTCDDGQDKPYKCPVTGCDKAYKNPNGLKYHQMHGHTEEDTLSDAERDAQKPYMCTIGYCNKRYKNLNGLKYHIEHSHIAKLKQYPPGTTEQLLQQQQTQFNNTINNNSNNNTNSILDQQQQQQQQSTWQPPTF